MPEGLALLRAQGSGFVKHRLSEKCGLSFRTFRALARDNEEERRSCSANLLFCKTNFLILFEI
jgi:hypothetical protein